jgi:hypothetical protein
MTNIFLRRILVISTPAFCRTGLSMPSPFMSQESLPQDAAISKANMNCLLSPRSFALSLREEGSLLRVQKSEPSEMFRAERKSALFVAAPRKKEQNKIHYALQEGAPTRKASQLLRQPSQYRQPRLGREEQTKIQHTFESSSMQVAECATRRKGGELLGVDRRKPQRQKRMESRSLDSPIDQASTRKARTRPPALCIPEHLAIERQSHRQFAEDPGFLRAPLPYTRSHPLYIRAAGA